MGRTYLEMNEDKANLLYLISNGEIKGDARLVKLVFLSNVEGEVYHYEFIKWHNGPYSKWIQNDVQSLINAGFVRRGCHNSYSITKKGSEFLDEIKEYLDASGVKTIDKIHREYNQVNNQHSKKK